ncbi:MAG: flavin reductase family protein [Corynebacterium sp.]|nr:flavin reductase family protein [Corynebacterium sp.]
MAITGDQLRDSVGSFPSGVTVVTTRVRGEDLGLTVSSFASLSLDPAMVLVCIDNRSQSIPHLTPGNPIGVSVLSKEQLDIAIQFGRHGVDRFAGVPIRRGQCNLALIDAAAAWFTGRVRHAHDGGDHRVITVVVEECGRDLEKAPLLYHRGRLNELYR